MEKVWSFNTTVRNPERMENMLRALSELEGVEFNAQGQEAFFGLQIKKRLYKPTKTTLKDEDLIASVHSEEIADDLDSSVVERVLQKYRGKSFDGSGRGRTAAGILNRFGLCVALQSKHSVIISDLAKKWLEHEIEDEELFTKFFLKWQYPNKIENGYDNFNIKPFIGTLSLITSVNKKWETLGNKPVGLSKLEYQLFVPSLIDSAKIEECANKIIEFRKTKESKTGTDKSSFVKNFTISRVQEIYGTEKSVETSLGDLKDYTDSSIRYFRVSGLLALRGKDTHIDIAKDKGIEVTSILEKISASADKFDSYESYFTYLSNIDSLDLPWKNEGDLQKITTQLSDVLTSESEDVSVKEYLSDIEKLPTEKKVESLEKTINDVRLQKLRSLKHDVVALDECIERLDSLGGKNYETLTARPSLDFEWYVSRALMVLNDAIEIVPSFKLGDDGIPTGFRANTSDIECYYSTFGMTVEVTLLLGRDQWIAEGQPVMRHFRDFEDKLNSDTAYCLFVAPYIHRDTLNTFWSSSKFSYEGKKQNIIPLTLAQFVEVLKIARTKILASNLNHLELNSLFQSISSNVASFESSQEWISTFPEIIKSW